jgi:hypothetical protein
MLEHVEEDIKWAREMCVQIFRHRVHLGMVMTTSTKGLS